jgi:hypothetical protein
VYSINKISFFRLIALLAVSNLECASVENETVSQVEKPEMLRGVKRSSGAVCDPVTKKILLYPPNDIGQLKQNGIKASKKAVDDCADADPLKK